LFQQQVVGKRNSRKDKELFFRQEAAYLGVLPPNRLLFPDYCYLIPHYGEKRHFL
jgi:hypothetical protein